MTYTHACPRCGNSYTDSDPDVYFCQQCIEARKAIAKEVDAKIASRPRKEVMSPLQAYDSAQKFRGFINAKDLL